MTGISLSVINKGDNLIKATDAINKNLNSIIAIETATIKNIITYHSKRLNSTPQMIVDLFSTFRAFSGTPWNDSTYHPSIATYFDEGTEGKIAHELLLREANSNRELVHHVEGSKISSVLKEIMEKHPDKKRVRGLIDAGALLKGQFNREVAQEILNFYKEDDSVQAVVFFDRGKDQETPDTPYMLKKGVKNPILLSGTTLEAISAKGIPLSEIFFYYDDRHTTGTDFVQIPDAINLLTVDETMLRRTFFQGGFRLRQLFFNQDLEYVVQRSAAPTLVNGGKRVKDLILTGIKNQALCKGNHTNRSFFEQIDNVIKQRAFNRLLDEEQAPEVSDQAKIVETYEKCLINALDDLPYRQHGTLKREKNTLEALTEYANHYKEIYKDEEVNVALDEVLERAKNSKFLTATITSSTSNKLGEELEIVQEMKVEDQNEQEKLTEVKTEQELLNELALYANGSEEPIKKESEWKEEDVVNLVYKNQRPQGELSMPALFDCSPKDKDGTVLWKEYSKYKTIFSQSLFCTENFALTFETRRSVFHQAQKFGRQILFIDREGKIEAHLLSLHETKFFKQWLRKEYKEGRAKNVWLSSTTGCQPFVKNPHAKLNLENKTIQEMLWQVNLFNGNAAYLNEHKKEIWEWLTDNYKLKIRFLKLQAEKDKKQRLILYNSPLLDKELLKKEEEVVIPKIEKKEEK
jgi:hypothetical protein